MSKHVVIGSNIQPGRVPGGFSRKLGEHATRSMRNKCSMEMVKAAANAALARRGLYGMPDSFIGQQALPPTRMA